MSFVNFILHLKYFYPFKKNENLENFCSYLGIDPIARNTSTQFSKKSGEKCWWGPDIYTLFSFLFYSKTHLVFVECLLLYTGKCPLNKAEKIRIKNIYRYFGVVILVNGSIIISLVSLNWRVGESQNFKNKIFVSLTS